MQAVFTVLPVRFARAALAVLRCVAGRRPGRRPRAGGLAADQLFDVLCVLIFSALFGVMRLLPAGAIYFWLKDLTQEFLKLHVVHSAVEIFDKVPPGVRCQSRPVVRLSSPYLWCAVLYTSGSIACCSCNHTAAKYVVTDRGTTHADRMHLCGGQPRGTVRQLCHLCHGPWQQVRYIPVDVPTTWLNKASLCLTL